MSKFSKQCTACNKSFSDLMEYMTHLRTDHKDITPKQILAMGEEAKWKLRK